MNILIEVRHPHHVHVFRHTYFELINRGHKVKVIAVDKEMSYPLLEKFNIPFEKVGSNKKGLLKKLLTIFKSTLKVNRIAKRFKADLLVAKASPTMAFTSFLRRKPYILFTDTEKAKLLWLIIKPFVNTFVSPNCYEKDFGKNHVRFDSFFELAYLHKNYFQPKSTILKDLNIRKNEKYVLIRFVSWNASHDIGQKGFSIQDKKMIVDKLSIHAKVFISSESELPVDLKRYQLNIDPDRIFDVMKYASIYIGEGATMASECVMIGTPAIYVNSIDAGTINKLKDAYLLFQYKSSEGLIEKAQELIINDNVKKDFLQRSTEMLEKQINTTKFIIWFIENYPNSQAVLKENPDYQYNFK